MPRVRAEQVAATAQARVQGPGRALGQVQVRAPARARARDSATA